MHEDLNEAHRALDFMPAPMRDFVANATAEYLADRYGPHGAQARDWHAQDPTDDGWTVGAALLVDLIDAGASLWDADLGAVATSARISLAARP